ncbi:alpha-protein kinase 3 [Anguilla anguilla]|uniref:alpha-protein kinase 3 n=1 Tax=Anguilla anguilla TaxID=7936 RepID=UPI0015B11624|nr:alpha-protein kinase 3 [Anguilla anguilla]
MSSRRPLLRSFSGSGRYGSFNGDVIAAPSGRADGRGYPFNMRTDTSYHSHRQCHHRPSRSTLCSVMAQLAVETQPSFETTLKSKAVSESCNAKFTCVVSGNPTPEVTWYKDDMEMDRYCGLPKYEIFSNGKTHTLHIYNCTQEDAAIYQASARNSKGIVSCSGVLEVGAMNEFMIHQRFFAKLKQKADSKRRDLEQSRRRGGESARAAVAEQPRVIAPARRPRLVRSPSEPGPTPSPAFEPETKPPALETKPVAPETKPVAPETKPLVPETKPVERPVVQLVERPAVTAKTPVANGFAAHPEPVKENGKPAFLYFGNKVEIITTRPAAKDALANKAIKTNRADSVEPAGGSSGGDGGSGPSGSSEEKPAGEEEMSLARYLTRCSKPEPPGPQQNGVPLEDASKPEPVAGRQVAREKETAKNRGAPGRGPLGVTVPVVRVSPETTGLKGPESPSTLASMFFSLRDMFFRNKSKNEDPAAAAANGVDPPPVCGVKVEGRGTPTASPQLPPSEPPQTRRREAGGRTQIPAPRPEPAEADGAPPSVDQRGKGPPLPKTAPEPPGCRAPEPRVASGGPTAGVTVRTAPPLPAGAGEDNRTAPPLHPHERVEPPASDWSKSPEAARMHRPPPETKVTVDRSQVNGKHVSSGRDLSIFPHKQEIRPPASTAGQVNAEADDTSTLHNRIHSASGAPSQNTQLHAYGLDNSQKKHPIGPGVSGLDRPAGLVDASERPVMPAVKPGQAEPRSDGAAQKCGGVSVGAGEIPAGNLRSRDNNAPCVQGPGERGRAEILVNVRPQKETTMQGGKGVTETTTLTWKKVKTERKEIPIYTAHKNEKGGLPWGRGEKGVTSASTELPIIVQVKLLEGPQPEKVLQNFPEVLRNVQKDGVASAICTPVTKPEVIKLQLRLPGVPQVLDRTCSKTSFLKSQVKNREPPAPFADNTSPIPEQSNLLKAATAEDPPLDMAESTGKTTPVTPIQQITERNKDLLQPKEIPKAGKQDQEVKPGRAMANENSCGQPSTGMAADSASVTHNFKKDNSGLSKTDVQHQHNSVKSSITIWPVPKVPTFVVPPISVTCSDDISSENNQPSKDEAKELDSVATLMQEVMSDLDSCVTLSAAGKKEINSTPDCVEEATPTNDSDMPQGITAPEPSVKKTPSIVSESPLEKVLLCADVIATHPDKQQQQPQLASDTFTDQHVNDKSGLNENNPINPESPLLSPTTSRRDLVADTPNMEASGSLAVPAIRVDCTPLVEKHSGEETSGDALPPPVSSCETSPRLRKRNSLTPIPSATPEELALGARRKIFNPKSKTEDLEVSPGSTDALAKKEQEAPYASPGQSRRPSLLQLPAGQQTPPLPRRSPNLGRKKTTLEVPKCPEETVKEADTIKPEPKSAEKDKLDPLKAPQVIRKIRAEPFPDNVGHIKLCCQFFNVLSDSTIKWCRDEAEIAEVTKSAGDESPVVLAIVHVSSMDCGVYSCSIKNEYGTDSTDFFLSATILSESLLRADLEVGQEIEMTPMLFTKGLADPGRWGNKFFGRIMLTESHIGDGCARKACRVKVIYGLEPAFESGSTCILKVRNPISYGKKDEHNLVERNLEITQQECKVQNMIREYCKVFSAEARVAGNFGSVLEVIPLYLMYQPASTIPYTTAEADLKGVFLKHCLTDPTGRLIVRTGSEVEQMCCTFQHWIHQWTNGNLLLTQLEGVDGKITNVGVATKLKGYQGLSDKATPKVFEQFVAQHQCNGYCTLLGLQSLKAIDSLTQPTKTKGSRSPMLNRKGSASPQTMRKGGTSPQTPRKVSSSPRLTRKSSEPGNGKPAVKNNSVETPKMVSIS